MMRILTSGLLFRQESHVIMRPDDKPGTVPEGFISDDSDSGNDDEPKPVKLQMIDETEDVASASHVELDNDHMFRPSANAIDDALFSR